MSTSNGIGELFQRLDGRTQFLVSKEIKELPKILKSDEIVERMVRGVYGNGFGVLVATNKRLIFIDKGWLYGLRVEDFPYDKINSIKYVTNMIYGAIAIMTSGNKAVIDRVAKQQARDFAEYVRERITAVTAHVNAQGTSSQQSSNDVVSRLERLAKLKEQGMLTEEEFLTQKKKILET